MRALTALATALVAFPAMALAHPGGPNELGFLDGFIHPLTGVDHIAAALIVGGLAAFSRSAGWVMSAFLGTIVAGILLGAVSPSASTAAETGILVGFAALATAFVLRNAAGWLVPVASAATGLAHGVVHGGSSGGEAFATGVVVATAILVGASYLVARLPLRSRGRIAG